MKTKNRSLGFRKTVSLAMLAAISIVCGKYLAINAGEVLRFSLENTPIILAGMAFGPAAGAIVGAVADLVGCVMVGYTINPVVTLGAAAVGVVSGLMPLLLKGKDLKKRSLTAICVLAAHLIGSVLIKTPGLSAYYSMPFGILLLWRVLNYLIVGTLDGVVVHALLKNKGVRMQINEITGVKE